MYFFSLQVLKKMAKKHLSIENRARISTFQLSGFSYRQIIDKMRHEFDVSVSIGAIHKLLKLEKLTGTLKRKKGPGAVPKTNRRMDRQLVRLSLKNRKQTLRSLSDDFEQLTAIKLSKKTISRRLRTAGLKMYRCRRKPLLSKANIHKRLAWAKAKIMLPSDDWKSVIWSDESRFCLVSDRPENCIRRSNEAYKPECLSRTVKFDEGVMIWGCFSYQGVGALSWIDRVKVNGEVYCKILEDTLIQSIGRLHPDGNYVFQQDNAPCHTAKLVTKWVSNKSIPLITDWPPQSPDLNPIENLWDHVDRELSKLHCTSRAELWKSIKQIWEAIPLRLIKKLVLSIPNRLDSVIENKGGPTKY